MRGRKITRSILIIIALFINIILWQNCAPTFQSTGNFDTVDINSELGTTPVEALEGFPRFQALIKKNCNVCHGNANTNFPEIVNFAKLTTLNDWVKHPKGLIVGGEPTKSLLYRRLRLSRGINDPAIQNMPYRAESVSQEDTDFIAAWINKLPKVEDRCEDHNVTPSDVHLRRLTKDEMKNSIKTILNVNHEFTNISTASGGAFGNDGKAQVTDQSFFDSYFNEIATVADKNSNQNGSNTCFNQNGNQQINCLKNQLKPIAELGFRKVINAEDEAVYMKSIQTLSNNEEHKYSAKEKLTAGIMAIFTSPKFIYLIREGNYGGIKYYNDFETATLISLSLLQSTPNRTLWNKARNGEFSNKNQLRTIITDIINNNESAKNVYANSFLSGWLDIDKIYQFSPDKAKLGLNKNEFSPVANDMRSEAISIFKHNFTNKKSINELVTGNTRFLNERLSDHYNINSNIRGNNLSEFELPSSSPYAGTGLLTSTLLVSSSLPDRSSIVFRGEKILYSFYCEKVGPAPAGVDEIDFDELGPNASQRDISAAHTKSSACAGCHRRIDPFGLALGNFSALGKYQEKDRFGNTINPASEIDGISFNNQKEMAHALINNDKFKSCFTQINLNYFSATEVDTKASLNQYCAVKDLKQNLVGAQDNTANLLQNILLSDYFLKWNDSKSLED